MTARRVYVRRWRDPAYREAVRQEAARIKSDGCSGPTVQLYRDGCFEHDIHCAFHRDFANGAPIEQEDADLMMKWYIQHHSWFGRFSPMAAWRYRALSRHALGFGRASWETGPRRLQERLTRAADAVVPPAPEPRGAEAP